MQLVCCPYAGGGASLFREWQALLPDVEVLAFEPPGRATRLLEEPLQSVEALANEAYGALRGVLDRPFALFGHSLGAVVAWRLASRFAKDGRPPIHLFPSGSAAPHVRSRKRLHDLPDRELVEELRRLNGTPRDVLDNEELIGILLPILRADFRASEQFAAPIDQTEPLDCSITALSGSADDEVSRDDIDAWREHTRRSFDVVTFEGDHFFVQTATGDVVSSIARTLASIRAA
jgi:surfactin synthase thioesterase subunit